MIDESSTHRTLLASERTYLAWWRTGVTTLAVALAAARVVPALADSALTWPYTVLGAGLAVVGVASIGYGELRRRAVDDAVREGRYAGPDPRAIGALTVAGIVLGLALLAIIVAEA